MCVCVYRAAAAVVRSDGVQAGWGGREGSTLLRLSLPSQMITRGDVFIWYALSQTHIRPRRLATAPPSQVSPSASSRLKKQNWVRKKKKKKRKKRACRCRTEMCTPVVVLALVWRRGSGDSTSRSTGSGNQVLHTVCRLCRLVNRCSVIR